MSIDPAVPWLPAWAPIIGMPCMLMMMVTPGATAPSIMDPRPIGMSPPIMRIIVGPIIAIPDAPD
jgi:hypothetical protein